MAARKLILPLAVVGVVALAPSAWATDPFGGLAEVVTANAQKWAAVLMILGALGAGGAISMGSHASGTWARNFLFGSIFLILAGLGTAIYARMQAMFGAF